jgi:hypothetical protein
MGIARIPSWHAVTPRLPLPVLPVPQAGPPRLRLGPVPVVEGLAVVGILTLLTVGVVVPMRADRSADAHRALAVTRVAPSNAESPPPGPPTGGGNGPALPALAPARPGDRVSPHPMDWAAPVDAPTTGQPTEVPIPESTPTPPPSVPAPPPTPAPPSSAPPSDEPAPPSSDEPAPPSDERSRGRHRCHHHRNERYSSSTVDKTGATRS